MKFKAPLIVMHINDVFTATIRDFSSDGQGIVKHPSGKVFFVPGVCPGDVGRFRITGTKGSYGFAQLEELIDPSDARVKPVCPHHGFSHVDCGNCPWQFVDYTKQLEAKSQRLRRSLGQRGWGYENSVRPIWASPQMYGYRNRAQLKTDGNALGYVVRGGSTLVPIEDCPILTEKNRRILWQLLNTLPREDFRPKRTERWKTIDIDEGVQIENLVLNSERHFKQANTGQNLRMKGWLLEKLSRLNKQLPVLELFSGSGNFTTVLSTAGFNRILAVEIDESALAELKAQALPGVETLVCNLFSRTVYADITAIMPTPGVLVLNPPRDGLKTLHDLVGQWPSVTEVFYISCDVATFARDANKLQLKGFRAMEIQPVDQFPHTPHLEILGYFKRSRISL